MNMKAMCLEKKQESGHVSKEILEKRMVKDLVENNDYAYCDHKKYLAFNQLQNLGLMQNERVGVAILW